MHIGLPGHSIQIGSGLASAEDDRHLAEPRIATGKVYQLEASQGIVVPDEDIDEDTLSSTTVTLTDAILSANSDASHAVRPDMVLSMESHPSADRAFVPAA